MQVHLIWHNSKDPQNLGGGLGPEQQAWEVGPSRTRTWMDRWTYTHTQSQERSLAPPPTPGNKWPFLQPGGGGGGHTLTPLSTTSQAIVLESTAPWQALGEEGAGAGWPRGEVQLDAGVGSGGRALRHQGTSHCSGGNSVYFSAGRGRAAVPGQHGPPGLSCQHGVTEAPAGWLKPGQAPRPFVKQGGGATRSWRPGGGGAALSPGPRGPSRQALEPALAPPAARRQPASVLLSAE